MIAFPLNWILNPVLGHASSSSVWNQELKRDLNLFFFGITGKRKNFHSIIERRRDIVRHIGRCDKHRTFDRSYGCIDVVIAGTLCFVPDRALPEGRRRISAEIHAHLVHFIQQNTGFTVPARFIIWMICPGKAPISASVAADLASSRTPPRESRTNFRPVARAIELASEVLPTPGGPTKQRIVGGFSLP